MSLGENIRNIRKSKGLSIMKIREMTGLSKSTISDLENDKSSPTTETLQKIADALKVSIKDFFKDSIKADTQYYSANTDCEIIKETSAPYAVTPKNEHSKQIDTLAAHLDGKNLTPKKMKLLEKYIDALFEDDDD